LWRKIKNTVFRAGKRYSDYADVVESFPCAGITLIRFKGYPLDADSQPDSGTPNVEPKCHMNLKPRPAKVNLKNGVEDRTVCWFLDKQEKR